MYNFKNLYDECLQIANEILPFKIESKYTKDMILIYDNLGVDSDDKGFKLRMYINNNRTIKITHFYMFKERHGYGTKFMNCILKYCIKNKFDKIMVMNANTKSQNFFKNKYNFKIVSLNKDGSEILELILINN